MVSKANEVIEDLFWWLFARCQTGLETIMKDGSINFDRVHLLYYKYHLKNPNLDRLYIASPDWKKQKQKSNNKSH